MCTGIIDLYFQKPRLSIWLVPKEQDVFSPFCNIRISVVGLKHFSHASFLSGVASAPNALSISLSSAVIFMCLAGMAPEFIKTRLNAIELLPAAWVLTAAVIIGLKDCFQKYTDSARAITETTKAVMAVNVSMETAVQVISTSLLCWVAELSHAAKRQRFEWIISRNYLELGLAL